jgi:hypothetical protein
LEGWRIGLLASDERPLRDNVTRRLEVTLKEGERVDFFLPLEREKKIKEGEWEVVGLTVHERLRRGGGIRVNLPLPPSAGGGKNWIWKKGALRWGCEGGSQPGIREIRREELLS